MPGLDGSAIAEEVNRRFGGIPVLMMSGSLQRMGSARGRWACLAKPFMPAALIAAAQQAAVPAVSSLLCKLCSLVVGFAFGAAVKPPRLFRPLTRRSGRIPALPYPPFKCLQCKTAIPAVKR